NLGNGNYGEANTIILNAPIEHGVTGHFSGAFKASGRKDIKYVPKQLNDNTWVAVEENYQQQGANENNIYGFVGTAGTKEAVDMWIESYEQIGEQSISDIVIKGEMWRNTVTGEQGQTNGRTLEEVYAQEVNKKNINKGMFAHMRVWQDGDVFYVAEAQSDYFQKNNAKKSLTKLNDILYSNEYVDLFLKVSEKRLVENEGKLEVRQNEAKTQWRVWLGEKSYGIYETKEEAEANKFVLGKRLVNESVEDSVIEKDPEIIKYINKKLDEQFQKLSKDEKQFIASQKEWEKRLLREALKEASLSGATTFRLPTPYTLSVIEGYVRLEEEDVAKQALKSAMDGDIIEYLDEEYIVEYSDIPNGGSEVKIAPLRDLSKISYEDFEIMLEEDGEPNTYIESSDGEFVYYTNRLYNISETIDTKDVTSTKEEFSIQDDLSDVEQTVARKYEELYELLKKERGEENVEVVTDENGFDWYETKIAAEEKNKPVVAFSKQKPVISSQSEINEFEDPSIPNKPVTKQSLEKEFPDAIVVNTTDELPLEVKNSPNFDNSVKGV
ncbi:MAG: hypothetical protein WD512_00135, partial [Candidatus Paceibacterota bacterium]